MEINTLLKSPMEIRICSLPHCVIQHRNQAKASRYIKIERELSFELANTPIKGAKDPKRKKMKVLQTGAQERVPTA